jgi:signal transduction histidine kinase
LISLFGLDGWMRARGDRAPEYVRDLAAEPLPQDRPYFRPDNGGRGRVEAVGYYDGIARMGAYRRVRDMPLVVSVQMAKDEVFADHDERVTRAMVIGIALSLVVLLAFVVFSILKRQRDAAIGEVAESEQRWRLALDAAGAGVWDWRPIEGTLYVSPQFRAIAGRTDGEVPRTVAGWLATIHPDDRDRVAGDCDAFLGGAPRLQTEYRLDCGAAGYRWVLDRAVVVSWTADHRPRRIIGLRRDVSERRGLAEELARRNEEMRQLQAAFAAREIGAARHRLSEAQKVARLGIIERDTATGAWTVCEHGRALLGLAPAAGYSLAQLLAHVPEAARAEAAAVLDGGDLSAVNLEIEIETAAEPRFLRAVGCASALSDEPPFITLQDVSAHRAAELEHARLKERMEEASRMESLGTLAGGIAHEINTPAQFVGDNLSFLQGGIDTLLAVAVAAAKARETGEWAAVADAVAGTDLEFLAKEMPEAARQGLEGVTRIGKIVQAVKEFCYPSSRERQPCDLNHMIESAATVTRNVWKYCAELDLALDPDLPPVFAIEGELNQVLINLIVNAAQAIEEKAEMMPGRIAVRTFRDGAAVSFSVTDSGIGIPPERHKRIFELFFTTKPPGQGTGQGLAISSAIVRRHGGTIDVESQPGQGARFTVTLPLTQPEEAGEAVVFI